MGGTEKYKVTSVQCENNGHRIYISGPDGKPYTEVWTNQPRDIAEDMGNDMVARLNNEDGEYKRLAHKYAHEHRKKENPR